MGNEKTNRKTRAIFPLIAVAMLLLFPSPVISQNECPGALPGMISPVLLELSEGEEYNIFLYQADNLSQVHFSIVPLNLSINEISIGESSGILHVIPSNEDIGGHTLLSIVANPGGCFDIQKLTLMVYPKPVFEKYFPGPGYIEINETDKILFKITGKTLLGDNILNYEWYRNGKIVKRNSTEYAFMTNFSDAGRHFIRVVIKDSRRQNATKEWEIKILNKNRPPYVKYELPSLVVSKETSSNMFSLYNYINDPDGDSLTFRPYFIDLARPDILKNESKIFEITISKKGELSLSPKAEIYMKENVRILAEDPEGLSVLSPPFTIRLATAGDKTDFFQRHSSDAQCKIAVQCSEWSDCLPEGIRLRECYDANRCTTGNNSLYEYESCDYNATCFDKLQNQGEEEVDCGGPCEPCPSCNDFILNQGEEKTDCGGPCPPCPSCHDLIKNQDETDVDCGGSCQGCNADMKCNTHNDCASVLCASGICTNPSCNDFRKNQDEEGIDCGGPCAPCPSCKDGLQNQREEGIDCGGPCRACISCEDGVKNQGELFTDCGGPCKPCGIITFLISTKSILLTTVPALFLAISIFIVLRNYNKDKIQFLGDFSKFLGFLPNSLSSDASSKVISTINLLHKIKKELFEIEDKAKVATDYKEAIERLYKELFEIEGSFNASFLKQALRSKIANPFLSALFYEFYMSATDISHEAPLFKIELNEKIDGDIRLLNYIRELL